MDGGKFEQFIKHFDEAPLVGENGLTTEPELPAQQVIGEEDIRKANDILVEGIVTPLKKEINSLRRDVDKFRKAVEKIPSCAHADNCPVSRQLQKLEERDNGTESDNAGK